MENLDPKHLDGSVNNILFNNIKYHYKLITDNYIVSCYVMTSYILKNILVFDFKLTLTLI